MEKSKFAQLLLISLVGVNSQCIKLVPSFHECFHSDIDLTDHYYENQLSAYESFDLAMELFRSYYQSLLVCDRANSKCDCFKSRMAGEPDYGLFFLNSNHFKDIKKLANSVKKGYRLRSMEEINRDPLSGRPFKFSTPYLNKFCHKNEYSYQMEVFYDELRACKSSGQALALATCIPTSVFNSYSQEKYLQCSYSYRDCAEDLKNFLALADLVRYPQLLEANASLFRYIQSLTNGSQSTCLSYFTVFMLLFFGFYVY